MASKRVPAGRIAVRLGLARLRRDESGATAVEFGIVALPFLALMFAILETGLSFFADQTFDTAVNQTARLIRTGQAQQQSFDATAFKNKVCDTVSPLFTCSDIRLDVRKYATFGALDLTVPYDEDGNLDVDEQYDDGGGSDIIVVRAYYEWPVLVSQLLTSGNSNLPNGKRLFVSTVAFRNEPFPW